VLRGEQVPAAEKVLSLFEPHTALVQRGKARQPTEFGRKVWLDEVDGGVVTRYAVLPGNASEKHGEAPGRAQPGAPRRPLRPPAGPVHRRPRRPHA
jgi:IS5 family transposase